MFAPPAPISLTDVDVEVKKYATKGWSIESIELQRIILRPFEGRVRERPVSYATVDLATAVERAAVGVVRNYFLGLGWEVTSVESENLGYDLVCRKGTSVQHVEVKGTSSRSQQFIISRNEFRRAQEDPVFVLCLVTDALNSQTLSIYTGRKMLSTFDFEPLQWQARAVT